MTELSDLSRRERQIMDIIFANDEVSVLHIQSELPDAPSTMAIRRMISILEEKGHLARRKEGREFLYRAKVSRKRTGAKALQHVLNTFFQGSVEEALATHLGRKETDLTEEEIERMIALIEEARTEGN